MNNYPIKNQVCTLEQARELYEIFKKAGIEPPGSLFSWTYWTLEPHGREWVVFPTEDALFDAEKDIISDDNVYPAYTGDELGAMLPTRLNYKMKSDEYSLDKNFSEAGIPEFHNGYLTIPNLRDFKSEYEAHAKADLAIQVLREGWIKPENFKYK